MPAEPVNPTDLVAHLDASDGALPHFASAGPGSLSLTGILRLLFEAETDEGRVPAAAGDVCSRNAELNRLVEELRVAVGR